MNISGVLVSADPDRADSVRQAVAALPGVEVHAVTAEGRLVVTVERDDTEGLLDTHRTLDKLNGVLATSLIYHHFEPDSD